MNPAPRRPRRVAAFVVCLALTGCGQASTESPTSLKSEALRRAQNTSGYQSRVLADGVVTSSEYEHAIDAEVACIRASEPGTTVTPPAPDARNPRMLQWGASITRPHRDPGLERRFERKQARCHETFLSDIGAIWAEESLPLGPRPADRSLAATTSSWGRDRRIVARLDAATAPPGDASR